ncbi:hypothetical protein AMTR_s00056p00124480 [Amborella trichopoda]|uniref:RING-type domain-containing protein n=1 Tax=Amborella trichopoda TaxID=13333 RepID=U5D471_AMBTC|nr:hypothetical protein AMTR_s00056p00124480 [Amborella trichopoda]
MEDLFDLDLVLEYPAAGVELSGEIQAPEISVASFPGVEVDDESSMGSCVVCMVVFEVGSMAKQMPSCPHVYHEECIRKWLQRDNSCPLCRCRILEKQ